MYADFFPVILLLFNSQGPLSYKGTIFQYSQPNKIYLIVCVKIVCSNGQNYIEQMGIFLKRSQSNECQMHAHDHHYIQARTQTYAQTITSMKKTAEKM